jgi:hypothetical protein
VYHFILIPIPIPRINCKEQKYIAIVSLSKLALSGICLPLNVIRHAFGSLQGIVGLSLLFETLLQTHEPDLFFHLKSVGCQP